MTFNQAIATLAMVGLSFGTAKAQSDNDTERPLRAISVITNIKPHQADEFGTRRAMAGAGVEYTQSIINDVIFNRLHAELTWQTGLHANKIHSTNKHLNPVYYGNIHIKQIKVVGGFSLGLRFQANDRLAIGLRLQTDAGLNFGLVNGTETWNTGDFCIYDNHFLFSPCLSSAPQLFIRCKRAEFFGGAKAAAGIPRKKKLSDGNKVEREPNYAMNNQMNYLLGVRLYLNTRGK